MLFTFRNKKTLSQKQSLYVNALRGFNGSFAVKQISANCQLFLRVILINFCASIKGPV